MKVVIYVTAIVCVLILALVNSSTYGAVSAEKYTMVTNFDLVGAALNNSQGKAIGVVDRVLIDSEGHAFAVINHGDYDLAGLSGVYTPVPIAALHILGKKAGEERVALSTDMEHLDLAPAFYPWKMGNPQYEADIYRFFKIEAKWASHSNSAGIFDSMKLLGLSVNNRRGTFYGLVTGVLIDSEGHAFAIVSHGDRDLTGAGGINTPIPFAVLRISKAQAGQAKIVVNRDMEHLDSAPFFDPTKENNRQLAESIYLYWGVEPYWREKKVR
jgi:ribosomal 30S subunit maturation factor RimM